MTTKRSGAVPPRATFTVTMLGILEPHFRSWLAQRNLMAVTIPGEDPNQFIVVPKEALLADGDGTPPDPQGIWMTTESNG